MCLRVGHQMLDGVADGETRSSCRPAASTTSALWATSTSDSSKVSIARCRWPGLAGNPAPRCRKDESVFEHVDLREAEIEVPYDGLCGSPSRRSITRVAFVGGVVPPR